MLTASAISSVICTSFSLPVSFSVPLSVYSKYRRAAFGAETFLHTFSYDENYSDSRLLTVYKERVWDKSRDSARIWNGTKGHGEMFTVVDNINGMFNVRCSIRFTNIYSCVQPI
jgi:hypothetical protein